MQQAGELAILEKISQSDNAQTEINKIRSRQRRQIQLLAPALGWVCMSRFSYQLLAQSIPARRRATIFRRWTWKRWTLLTFGISFTGRNAHHRTNQEIRSNNHGSQITQIALENHAHDRGAMPSIYGSGAGTIEICTSGAWPVCWRCFPFLSRPGAAIVGRR